MGHTRRNDPGPFPDTRVALATAGHPSRAAAVPAATDAEPSGLGGRAFGHATPSVPGSTSGSRSLVLDWQRSVKRCETGWLSWSCKRRTCPVCGPRRRRLTARALVVDARVSSPTHAITLTTRDPDTPGHVFRAASAAVWKRLRRDYGPVEYYGQIEWTTGVRAADGARRMHGHYLVKGLGLDVDVAELSSVVKDTWLASTSNAGYGAWVVDAAELVLPGAAIHYLNLHHTKAYQRPPNGWRGMVERASKGYWHRPIGQIRTIARLELRAEALVWASNGTLAYAEAFWLVEQDEAHRAAQRVELRAALQALRDLRTDLSERRVDVVDERVVHLGDGQQGLWNLGDADEDAGVVVHHVEG